MPAEESAPSLKNEPFNPLGCCVAVAAMCLFVLLFLSLLLLFTGLRINISTIGGEKVGQVFSVNKEGFLSRTWEAELVRGGMNNGSGAFGIKPFDFTVPNDALADQVKKYMETGTEVIIRYQQPHIYSTWLTESYGIYLVSIRPAK